MKARDSAVQGMDHGFLGFERDAVVAEVPHKKDGQVIGQGLELG